MLAHGLDGCSISAPALRRSCLALLIVATLQQDGQKQSVMDVAGVQQRCPRRYTWPHRGTDGGRRSASPLGLRWFTGSSRSGAVVRTLLMSLWRSSSAEIVAISGGSRG